jgi:hypothetical protein
MQRQSAGLTPSLLHSLNLNKPEAAPSLYPEGTPRCVQQHHNVQVNPL